MSPAEEFQALVQVERERQDARWGPHPKATNKDQLYLLLAVLGEEVGEANRAVLELGKDFARIENCAAVQHLRDELVQVAAVAQKFWEALR